MRRSPLPLVGFTVIALLAAYFTLAADPDPQRATPQPLDEDVLCSTPQDGVHYPLIQDFPCTVEEIQQWVDQRKGIRQRHHAWYLFAGLNRQAAEGKALWRSWPTATQTFGRPEPDAAALGAHRLSILSPLPGAILERPAPGTPRVVGSHDFTAPVAAPEPGVEPTDLALAGAPTYATPEEVLENPDYAQCIANGNLLEGATLQNEGNVMIAGVVFSPDARRHILDQELWKAGKLDSLMPRGDQRTTEIPQMPHGALVLKPMLWPVPHDRYVPLPVWDNLPPTQDLDPASGCERYAGFERQELWKRAVALTAGPDDDGPKHRTVSYLLDGNVSRPTALYPATDPHRACKAKDSSTEPLSYVGVEAVPLERFYTIRYSAEEFASLDPCDRALLDQSAYWSYGRAFDRRDALVLVGMHIMTKEQPRWTFQSAWWNDLPEDCYQPTDPKTVDDNCPLFAGQRPAAVEGPATWRNYQMVTAYGMTQQPSPEHMARFPPDVKADTAWPVMYNPYIELAAAHPIETNCMNCHLRAAWPSRLAKHRQPHGAYLVAAEGAPNVIERFDHTNEIFDGLLLTDALWAISDRACPAETCAPPAPPGGGARGSAP